MAEPIDFPGSNFTLGPPKGEEDRVGSIRVFRNGACVVMKWKFTAAELKQVIDSDGEFMVSVWCDHPIEGPQFFPQFAGSESTVRGVVVDHGAIW